MPVKVKKGKDMPTAEKHVIVVEARPANIESADVSTWRSAVNSAKAGYRNSLFRLYENVIADGVLGRAIDKRTEAITNADLVFQNAKGEPDQLINELIDTVEFEKFLTAVMEAKAWGISVVDVMSAFPMKFYNVPKRNLNTVRKLVVTEEYSDVGLSYQDSPYLIEIVNHSDPLGYIFKAAVYVIYKRGGFGDWAEFVEIFGMPFRAWKYSAYDPTVRDELINALQSAGSRLNMVVPKEAELDQKDGTSSTDGELFNKFVDRCDKEILISVLGQTMTTQEGSSKSQSETHKDVEEDINKSDRRFVRRVLNNKLLPILESMGLPVAGGKFVFPEQGESLGTADRVDIALKIKDNGVPVSDEYIYEISGVRKPMKGEKVSRTSPALEPVDDNDEPPEPGKEKKLNDTAVARMISFFAEALGKRAPLKF